MKNSPPFENTVIELGKKILVQFDKGEDRGILTSWMSHHVAELITRAENEKGSPAEQEIRQACVETILKLWSHRNGLPNGSRPFESAERAAQTLARLAPDSSQNFYFRRHAPAERVHDGDLVDSGVWLEFAEAFDKAAREFIRLCISHSLGTSAAGLRDWLQAAYGLEDKPAVDIKIINSLIESASDEELDEIANSKSSKSTKLVAQLDKIIESLTSIRAAVALGANNNRDTESSNEN